MARRYEDDVYERGVADRRVAEDPRVDDYRAVDDSRRVDDARRVDDDYRRADDYETQRIETDRVVRDRPRLSRAQAARSFRTIERNIRDNPALALLAAVAAIALLGLIIYMLAEASTPSRASGPTAADILKNPSAFYEKTVTVQGRVSKGYGKYAVTLDDGSLLTSRDLLVIAPKGLPVAESRPADNPIQAGDDVQVSGVVRPFRQDEFERQFGFDLDDRTFLDFENQPSIVASDIQMTH